MSNRPHYINIIFVKIRRLLFSSIGMIKAHWWGIKCKGRFSVDGKIHFRRLPFSSVELGKNIGCNSCYNSNLIGVNRPCMISTLQRGAKIVIGDNCGFSGTVIGAFESIVLEDNVRCGANTLITDADWHLDDPRSGNPAPVYIHENVWLGEGVKVLKGVEIGENTVIGAGSVVVKSIPANVVAAGNPCKVIKPL